MRTHPRLRRGAKWAGLLLSASVFAIGLVSIWFTLGFRFQSWAFAELRQGCFAYYGGHAGPAAEVADLNRAYLEAWVDARGRQSRVGAYAFRTKSGSFSPPGITLTTLRIFRQPISGHVFRRCITIPLWLPFLLLLTPTAFLWHRDRRRPTEGHCPNCNYNLTANQSGTCPECGNPTPKSESATQAEEPPRPQQASNSQPQ